MKKNNHIVFVDDEEQLAQFDPAQHLEIDPALASRTYNRPRLSTLQKYDGVISRVTKASAKQKKLELEKIQAKRNLLNAVIMNMEAKKTLLTTPRDKIAREQTTDSGIKIVKLKPERKK
eukprot:GEZU01007112.1.p1 GENE.GEZU01007112.1~~GEZU01007112.1.p1  ORF type:complete len:119 (+),score=41.98 GEZU01007112.1:103-459(+)